MAMLTCVYFLFFFSSSSFRFFFLIINNSPNWGNVSNLIGQYITATLMRRFYDVMYCCFLSFFFSVNYVKMLYMHIYVCM